MDTQPTNAVSGDVTLNTANEVKMTQEELNTLINKKYAKGAEKAKSELLAELGIDNIDVLKTSLSKQKELDEANKSELQKVQEQLKSLQDAKDKLEAEANKLKSQAVINNLALKHGIKETDVFEILYAKESSREDFDAESFIEGLKVAKPYVFGTSVKTDSTSSNKAEPKSFQDQIRGLSLKELEKIAKNL